MAQKDLVIGIDSSTTATKAVAWDVEGRAVAVGRDTYPLSQPHSGWGEQNAREWVSATRSALRQVAEKVQPERIRAIGITHQRESFVCTDSNDKPLREAILWLDSRSHAEVKKYGTEELHEITGKPPDVTPALYKLYWLRENEPDVLKRAARIYDVHAYLAHDLTGEFTTSWSSADPLGLVDMRTFDWSDTVLSGLGIDREMLPGLAAPGEVIGGLTAGAARETGLPQGIPVVAGAGDGQAAGLGANVTRPGLAYLNLGTAIASGTYADEYAWSRAYRTLGGPIPDTYTLETLLRGGTYTIDWFVKNIAGTRAASELDLNLSTEEILEVAAAKIPDGSEGLIVLPYLSASSTPYWDPLASGVMFGLRGRHTKAHIYRAVLEGLAFEQRLCTSGLEKGVGRPIEKLLAMGGASRSPLFCQILADVTGRTVTTCKEVETTCLGAAILAAAATDDEDIRATADAMSGENLTYEPDGEKAEFYAGIYEDVYEKLYHCVSDLYPAMSEALDRGQKPART